MDNNQAHWENVYQHKQPHEVSWTQALPGTSLRLICEAVPNKDAAIIDMGGGDSNLVDHLLREGYTNLTVADISAKALERAQQRLGDQAAQVQWIVADAANFTPPQVYDCWHDRAVFHFLTSAEAIEAYTRTVNQFVSGHLVLGTFSENGPLKCSGLEIRRYSQEQLTAAFSADFVRLECFHETHTTPFQTQQEFTFCHFRKK
jgi:2-polyprenyl-3-methyl-5-hydroxy-6-metoxy-1,4-benzoquinol methylase